MRSRSAPGRCTASNADGKVTFISKTENSEIRLQSGKYYIVETKAPTGYNLYGKVIEINVNATYNNTFIDGTYVNQCPNNGIATVDVTDSKVTLPSTGGYVIISLILLKKKKNK